MRVRYQKTHIPGSIPGRADMPSIFIFVCFIVAILYLQRRIKSKTIEIRFVLLLLLLLLRNELSHSDQDQTRSELDRIRHDQGFPNS